MTSLRRRVRKARRVLVYGAAVGLVLVAVLLGIASRLLPLVESHPARVAAWLSERAGRTVAFEHLDTQWTRRGPLLQLDGLRIGEGEQAFVVGDAEMLVSIYAGLLPGRPLSELRLRGLELTVEREPGGRWRVRGLPGPTGTGDPFAALEGLGELQVIDGGLTVLAPRFGIDAHIPRIDLRLQVRGDTVRAGMHAWPSAQADAPLDVVVRFDRDSGDGRAYAATGRTDLAAWSPLLRMAGITVDAGHGQVEAWARLDDHRLAQVTLEAKLQQVGLRETQAAAGVQAGLVDLGQVELRARWQRTGHGWRFDAPRLRIGSGQARQVLDGLVVAGGERFVLLVDALEAGPLFAIAGLSDALPASLRGWLRAARPQASLRRVELVVAGGDALHASARVDALGFDPAGNAPGMHGLAGELRADGDGFALDLDAGAPLRVVWPRGFARAHEFALDGTIIGWRHGEAWSVGTPGLRIDGVGADAALGLQVRGAVHWQGDGLRPRMRLAASIDDVPLQVAKGFWLHHRMSPGLVDWLDTALVAGTLRDGRVRVSGDLDDWPFAGNASADDRGVFEASARIDGATLKFHRGWPAVHGVDADIRFVADGFQLEGSGRLGKLRVETLAAAIDHYNGGVLTVQAGGAGDAGALLGLLQQSPLNDRHAQTLRALRARGPVRASFEFALPLQSDAPGRIRGTVTLDGARLADTRRDLAFEQVTGTAQYWGNGFAAEALGVRHAGQAGQLSLRAGAGHVHDPGNAFEAELRAAFGVDALLERAPRLAWLEPHLQGRSAWEVALQVPRATAAGQRPAPARLSLRSSLVGTALDLPAPLAKPAAMPMATKIEVALPLERGEVQLALGDRLALRARGHGGDTGVRIVLGDANVTQPPPQSGLVASGHADTLDALGWIALATAGGGQPGGLPLRGIDIRAQRLRLLGGVFPQTRIVISQAAGEVIAVRAAGEALAGTLTIDRAAGATGVVNGQFQRVYWRSADGEAAATEDAGQGADDNTSATPAQVAKTRSTQIDPAGIPRLVLDIGELRIGDAQLGQASLRTRPTAAGLRIEQLRTKSTTQSIDVSGVWTGRAGKARTRMQVSLTSEDVGALMAGLGFGGRVAGGQANVRFNANWQGSPADFALGTIDGALTLDARDGRLLEVEPGAGRVLGLLSITELPRRLTLDFRDFFAEGFTFNTVSGAIDFANGVARTDNLVIEGPAATIDLHGTANLRARSYNQVIEVRPKAGNLLTAVGAIAGGPVGAAIGAAANVVLKKPLGKLAAKTYRVTGPWKDPEVEVVDDETKRAAAAEEVMPAS